ncbi:C2H2-type zinc finger protein [Halegenticoccus tardaugens]|uniref:C2H2-type zinc finger protein n=1 Tax=Halegenticoccus tardaugens TaxID=2071624 RepID=UPI001E5B6B57|nr:C2H2-type zinc finger protein [Halegenticoccus tardaugens]
MRTNTTATDANPTQTGPNPAQTGATVPDGEQAYECPDCGRPFAREKHLALHRGLDHAGSLDEAEREAFYEAYDEEEAEIRRFRIVALGALVLVYFGFLFAYAVFA